MLLVVGAEATRTTVPEKHTGNQRSFALPPDDSGLSSNANSSAYSILPEDPVTESTPLPASEETSSSTFRLSLTYPIATPSIPSPPTTASERFIPGTQFPENEAAVPIVVVDAAVAPTPETAGQADDETSAAYSASLKRASTFMLSCARTPGCPNIYLYLPQETFSDSQAS